VTLPDGRTVFGWRPGSSAVTLLEHRLRDDLARAVQGVTEATLPYGRPDVLTGAVVFEVEPADHWRHCVRQVLAYAAQTGCTPALALFGAASPDRVLRLYLRIRDSRPPIVLWWRDGTVWRAITSRAGCRQQRAAQ
jgi:hypothetical protein